MYNLQSMGSSRVFFPQQALDQWLSENKIEITSKEFTIRAEGRRYRIVEAVRVLSEVSGLEDANEIVGKVKSVNYVTELGAELLGTSMVVGDNAYEVVRGFVGSPIGQLSVEVTDRKPESERDSASQTGSPKTDEELLAQFLAQNLE
jgi:hypothetical protein